MNPLDALNDEDKFAALLARYSETLKSGGDVDLAADPALSPQLVRRLHRALRFLRRLRRFQPSRGETATVVMAENITLHDGIVGKQVGRFHIQGTLGHGGGGVVFLAVDPELGREVAGKVPLLAVLLTPVVRRRFLREARAAASLDHPNLVPVYEAGESNGVCYLVSAYCRGGNLAQWLVGQTGPVPVRQAAALLADLADAVQYVHDRGIYHRDIKPGNILLDPRSGDGFTPRLTDFGLAKLREAQNESTGSGTLLGTVSYMAPEQAEGRLRDIGPATDVYGLGAVLYEVLTSRPPFRGATNTDTLRQTLTEEPAPLRRLRQDVPADLQTICLKCLEKEPARRYRSAAELAGDLRRFLAGEAIQARPLRRIERLRKWVRRRPAKTILFASGLLFVLVLVAGSLLLASLEQKYDAGLEAASKKSAERQQILHQKESRLRQDRYANDIAQAWHSWENRRQEEMAAPLDTFRLPSEQDKSEDLRGFEWYYLSRLARSQLRRMHYPARLYSFAFSPDGTMCASGHAGGVIVLWDTASGRQLECLKEHKLDVYALAYSPDGKYLASGSGKEVNGGFQGELLLWETRTRKALRALPAPRGAINSVAFSPDGRTLATAITYGHSSGSVMFWEVPSGTPRTRTQSSELAGIVSMAFSSDGKRVVIGSSGRTSLCDPVTGEILETHKWNRACEYTVACGHKDAIYVSGGHDRLVRLHSLRPSDSVLTAYEHADQVWSVALSPDDRTVASITREGVVKLWEREGKNEPISFKLPQGLGRVVSFSPDGRRLVAGSELGPFWVREVTHTAETLSWLGHREGKEPREAWAVAFSPDGKILASAGDDHMVRLWDPSTGRELATLRGHQSLVTSLAFSPNGKLLASGSFDKKAPVKLWEVASGKEIATLNGHNDHVDSVVFSPDGKILATSGRDRIVRLWDVATRSELPVLSRQWLDSPGHWVESMAFCPDGRTLALASNGQAPLLWDMQEQKMCRTLPPHPPSHVAVAFSPDGKTLVTGDSEGAVRFWNVATGALRLSVRRHTDAIQRQ